MSIEYSVFQRKTLIPDRLIPFGFRKVAEGYFFSRSILEGQFSVEVRIDDSARLASRVIDADSGEEYAPVNVEMSTGAFVGTVREAYRAVLQSIADACYSPTYFMGAQSNRIASALFARYGESPDFPFATAPTYGVFRHPSNRKWYGLIMDVPLVRVTKDSTLSAAESPVVDVLNLKIDPAIRADLLSRDGFYTCYHMNKESWISIVLDDTVPDADVLALLDHSRTLILPRPRASRK